MQLKSTVSVQQEIEINLETPSFFKSPMTSFNEYLMVKEECTIKVLIMADYTSITNEATEKAVKDIKKAYDSWEHISEEEFMEALDKALKDFNFKPSLRTITASNGSEVTI